MPTQRQDSDRPTLTDWLIGFLIAAFVVFGAPAFAELVTSAVTR